MSSKSICSWDTPQTINSENNLAQTNFSLNWKPHFGFTLLEILLVLLLLGIGLTMTIPSFESVRDNLALETDTRLFVQTLKTTRLHALNQHLPLTVCETHGMQHCEPGGEHLLVFIDTNQNGQLDDTETVFRSMSFQRFRPSVEIFNRGKNQHWFFLFLPTGFTLNNGTAHFANKTRAYQVTVRNSGLVRMNSEVLQ